MIQAGGVVETTGATGTVTLNGTGGAPLAGSFNDGVEVTGTGSLVTSGGGNVSITGTAGPGVGWRADYGIRIAAGGNVTAGGSGTVTLNGTGGGTGAPTTASS